MQITTVLTVGSDAFHLLALVGTAWVYGHGVSVHVRSFDDGHARISYRVRGHDYMNTIDPETFLPKPTVRLVVLRGETFPIVELIAESDGRDVTYAPYFLRFNDRRHSLDVIPLLYFRREPSGLPSSGCFRAPHDPLVLFRWRYDSAIPIRDVSGETYSLIRLPGAEPAVVQVSDIVRLGSDAPAGATPPPNVRLANLRVQIYREAGAAPELGLCRRARY